MPDNQAIIKT